MQLYSKYAINKSEGEVQLIEGKIKIPVGGWRGLTTKELEHEDIVYALRRNWIVLEVYEPTNPDTPEKPKLDIVSPEDQGHKEFPIKKTVQVTDEVKIEEPKVEEIPAEKPKRTTKGR